MGLRQEDMDRRRRTEGEKKRQVINRQVKKDKLENLKKDQGTNRKDGWYHKSADEDDQGGVVNKLLSQL